MRKAAVKHQCPRLPGVYDGSMRTRLSPNNRPLCYLIGNE
jgi:hypothetical protein